MKAVVYTEYGTPDVLQLKEIEKPAPGDNQVLVKVYASSVNDFDWGLLRGKPFVNRIINGLFKPTCKILGCDIAGRVEAIGRNVKRFQPGDEVFGDLTGYGWGGFAEYVCANENALTVKPVSMTFEQAAAIPQAALLALQGLRDKRQIQPGQKVLINGAGGGAGTFAVQIAKSYGVEVTGVDNTRKLDIIRKLGAEHVIDYTKEDFTKNGKSYDFILDMAAHHSIFDYKRALSPGGIYVMVGGSSAQILQAFFLSPLISIIAGMTDQKGMKRISILGHRPNKDLDFIIKLFEAGIVVPVIDKHYKLSEVAEALRYFGEGNALGKVIITM
jgi:NADPH:quinone reductase-like Zn-dependent oxidoreductase